MTEQEVKERLKLHREEFRFDHGWDITTVEALDMAIQALERKQLSRDEFIYGLKACGFTVKDGQTYYEEQELIKCFDDLYFSQDKSISKPTGIMLYPQVEGITPTVVKPQENDFLDKIRAEIQRYRDTIDRAIAEDTLKIESMKEAYNDCLEIIDKYKAEIEPQERSE